MTVTPFEIAGHSIHAGTSVDLELPISVMSNRQTMSLTVKVFHGKAPGPVMFVSGAVHGDEIIGVEIIRRLANRPSLDTLRGTLILVPIVNGYGFLNRSRYLPDRRDLNRCFPGSETSSLADRLAHLFMTEIVARSDYGIDLHSAAIHRENLPQARVSRGDERTMAMARAFGAPAIIVSDIRDGSLRKSAADAGVPVLLFEGGEGLRFDETAVRAGLAGILRVMQSIGMVDSNLIEEAEVQPFLSEKSFWLRAPEGGLLRFNQALGDTVQAGEVVGVITDIFGDHEHEITTKHGGVVIGRSTMPIVNEGDAVAHIARSSELEQAGEQVDALVEQLADAPMFYEDEII